MAGGMQCWVCSSDEREAKGCAVPGRVERAAAEQSIGGRSLCVASGTRSIGTSTACRSQPHWNRSGGGVDIREGSIEQRTMPFNPPLDLNSLRHCSNQPSYSPVRLANTFTAMRASTPNTTSPAWLDALSLPSSTPRSVNLFALVPGLLSGSLPCLFALLAWSLWTVIIPLLVLLPVSFYFAQLWAALWVMVSTGVMFLVVAALPIAITFLSLRSSALPSSAPLAHATSHPSPCHRVDVTRVLAIVNPHAGVNDNRLIYSTTILPFLNAHNVQCVSHFTERTGHARQIMHAVELTSYQCVIVVGGDGTLHEVINGLMTRKDSAKLPLALIPCGTGNAVGTDLGTLDVESALQRVIAGEVCYIDLNHLTSQSTVCPLSVYSVEEITWGLIGVVAVQAELPIMRRLGHARFDLCAVWNVLKGFSSTLHFQCQSLALSGPFVTVYINNTQHFAQSLRAAPRAVLDDGKMDVLMLERGSRSLLFALFLLMGSGAHVGGEGVRYLQEEEVLMRPDEGRGVIGIDGEIVEFEGEFTVKCQRKILPIMMESVWKGRRVAGLGENAA